MNRRILPSVGFLLVALWLLFWPQKVLATTEIKPELTWQRSLESEAGVVHETKIGQKVSEALMLPLSPGQVVWDNGLETPDTLRQSALRRDVF